MDVKIQDETRRDLSRREKIRILMAAGALMVLQ